MCGKEIRSKSFNWIMCTIMNWSKTKLVSTNIEAFKIVYRIICCERIKLLPIHLSGLCAKEEIKKWSIYDTKLSLIKCLQYFTVQKGFAAIEWMQRNLGRLWQILNIIRKCIVWMCVCLMYHIFGIKVHKPVDN